MSDPDRLALTLPPAAVSLLRPPAEAAGDAFERLADALANVRARDTQEHRDAAREAHDALRDAQHAFGLALTAEGYRVDRAHSFVIANALTTLQRDYALPERHARALRVRLIGSPPFAEDRLPLPALLEPAWNAALGVIPA